MLGEEYGLRRESFPMQFREHELHILHNEAHKTTDNRFRLHLTLHCPRCDTSHTIRGRLPIEVDEYNYRAAAAKLVVIGGFREKCPGAGQNHKTYYGY